MISPKVAEMIGQIRLAMGGITIDALTNSVLKLHDEAFGDGVDMSLRIIDERIKLAVSVVEQRSLQQAKADIAAAHQLLKDTINREDD